MQILWIRSLMACASWLTVPTGDGVAFENKKAATEYVTAFCCKWAI